MTTLHETPERYNGIYQRGSGSHLQSCECELTDAGEQPLNDVESGSLGSGREMAGEALRVLGWLASETLHGRCRKRHDAS